MKRVLKTCCVVLMLMAMCVSLVACGGPDNIGPTIDPGTVIVPEGEVKFTFQADLLSETAADAFVDSFIEKYPNVSVIKDYNPGNIPARIASGEIGDVFKFIEDEAYNYAITQQALLPLNQFIAPLSIDVSQVYTGIMALGQIEGQLYMVPHDYNHVVMIYNKTAVDTAGVSHLVKNGWTWEEFKQACKTLTIKEDDLYTQVGAKMDYMSFDPVYIPFLEGFGGKWYDTETKEITLDDEKVLEGINELLGLAKDGYMFPQGGDTTAYTGLQDTDFVFRTMVYPQLTLMKLGQTYDDMEKEWDFVTFPKLPVHKVGTGSSGFGVYRFTKNPNAAAALALHFFSAEGQTAFHSYPGGSVPLVKELADDGFWRYESSKGTDSDWSEKNFDAFIAYPEADTVGRVSCILPAQVANVIKSNWGSIVREYFSTGSYDNALTTAQETANQIWDRIIASQE